MPAPLLLICKLPTGFRDRKIIELGSIPTCSHSQHAVSMGTVRYIREAMTIERDGDPVSLELQFYLMPFLRLT